MWSDEEEKEINKAFEDAVEHGSVDSAAVAAATKAAELLAARNGTTTLKVINEAKLTMEAAGQPLLAKWVCEHIATQGARIVVLEKLAYVGEHHFPDQTWKARFEEERRRATELEKERDDYQRRMGLAQEGEAERDAALEKAQQERDEAQRSADELQRQRDSYRESWEVVTTERDAALEGVKKMKIGMERLHEQVATLNAQRDELAAIAKVAIEQRDTALTSTAKWQEAARIRGERMDEFTEEKDKLGVECNKLRAEAHRAHRRADIAEQEARITEVRLRINLEAARQFIRDLSEVLCPPLLIKYAEDHPQNARRSDNVLKWDWQTLDKVVRVIKNKPAFLSRQHTEFTNYLEFVERELRAWWTEAMGNLPGPALDNLLTRIRGLLPTPTAAKPEGGQ